MFRLLRFASFASCLIFCPSFANAQTAPTFTSSPVLSGIYNAAYTYNITTTDAESDVREIVTASALPNGLVLTDNGDGTAQLTGTVLETGSFPITLTVRQTADITQNEDQVFTVIVAKATASVALNNLNPTYDGTPKSVTITTVPVGLTVDITFNGSATVPTNAGSYAVVATISDLNYEGTTTETLVISKAPLTIDADDKVRLYGQTDPVFTFSYTGFLNGDDATDITVPTATTTAVIGSNVGTYPITLGGGAATNYTLTLTPGVLTVNKAILTVDPDSKTRQYGAANPSFTLTYTGFLNGDGIANITPPTASTPATTFSSPGSYNISLAGGTSINYSFSFNIGSLIVTHAILTATADNKTKVYGDANPSLTIGYVGFMGAESAGNLTSQPVISTSVNSMSDVGIYDITLTGGSSPNYTIVLVNGIFTITEATLSITAANKTKVYGDSNPPLTINYAGFRGSDNPASLSTQPSISTGALNTSNVGNYAITLAGGASSNYTITLNNGILTIAPASLNAFAENKAKIYGDANPTLTIAYVGFKGSDNPSFLTEEPLISTGATATSNVGSYPITMSGGVSSNYSFVLTNGTLSITKAALLATAVDKTKVYGDVNPTLTISYVGFKGTDNPTFLTTQPLISTSATTASGVGSYAITLSGGSSSNYTISLVNGTLTVGKATITATASNASRVYNMVNPTFTINYSGFVNGDAEGVVNVLPTASTTATISSPVGTYPIDVVGASDDNYVFAYVNGTLTIGKATPVVNWSNPSDIIYGTPLSATQLNANAAVPGTFAYSLASGTVLTVGVSQSLTVNFNPGDAGNYNSAAKTVFITVIKATPVITWPTPFPIKVNEALSVTQLNASSNGVAGVFVYTPSVGASFGSANTYNLSVSFTPTDAGNYNSVPVTQVQIVVNNKDNPVITWAIPSAITYGTLLSAGQLNASASVSGSYAYTPTFNALLNSGSQTLSVSFTPTDGITYNTVISSVQITVNKATLAASAASTSRIYGASNPTFTINYAGFVNSETVSVMDTAPTAICSAIDSDNAGGVFPIIPGGGVDNNYSLTYVNGSLTITKAPLTAKADNKSRSYGLPNPTNTISYTGFVNGDTETEITQPSASTSATVLSNVGSHTITLSGGSSVNYNLTLQNGTLTISASALIATASDISKVYGEVNPALTIVYSGFLNGDNVLAITPPIATTSATTTSGVGVYSIALSGGSALNYGIIPQSGNLTITKAPLTVTANNTTRVYGVTNPALTINYSGFVNSETSAAINNLPLAATVAVNTTMVGTTPITVGGGSDDNYSFNYVSGLLTITKATLTATANNQSRTYGTSNPIFTINYSGFVNGETSSVIDSTPSIFTTATTGSSVGTYPITISGGSDGNYSFNYILGTLTISKGALTATAANATRSFGASNPIFVINYSGFVNGETTAVLDTPPTASTTATIASPTGTYGITVSGGLDNNYIINNVNGFLTINDKITPTITWANPATITYGTALSTTQLNATASVPGAFVYGQPIGTILNALTQTLSVSFTPTDQTNYNVTTKNVQITVNKATPVITWATPTSITYGTVLSSTQLSATASVVGTFIYTPALSTLLNAGVNQTLTVNFTPTDQNNYISVGKSVQITVNKAAPVVTWVNPSDINYGSTLSTIQLNAAVNVAGTFVYSPASGTLLNAGVNQTLSVGFTPSDAANYNVVNATTAVTVKKASLTIAANNRTRMYGNANPVLGITFSGFVNNENSIVLDALPTITTTATPASPAGTYSITVSGGNDNNYSYNYAPGTLTISKAPLIVTADDKDKLYGEPNPALTSTYTGFLNGDDETDIDVKPNTSTQALVNSPVGDYVIALSGGLDNNYDLSKLEGKLVIKKAKATVTVAHDIFTFDGLPKGAAILTDPAGLTISATYNSNTTQPINPGKYDVIATIHETNYEGLGTGTIIINRAPVLRGFQLQIDEDSQLNFELATFNNNFSDDPGDKITTLKISSLPVSGSLQWKGKKLMLNDVITLDNGALTEFLYLPSPDFNGSDGFLWNASDGLAMATSAANVEIKVVQVNDPPVLSTNQTNILEYSPGDPAINIAKSMIINDVDNAAIFSASISFSENYSSGDELSYKASNNQNIKASFDKALGKLTLTGKDLKSNYETALAEVTYSSTLSNSTSLLVKKIVISVSDSSAASNAIVQDIQITEILPELSLVNSFTPNEDGVNDFWDIVNLQFYTKVAISIFEQNGTRLFACNTLECKWDGKFNGKVLPMGSYFYVIDLNDGKRKYQGTVTILR